MPKTNSKQIDFNNDGVNTHLKSLKDALTHMWSASSVDGFGLTDNANGTVTIANGTVVLRSTNSHSSELKSYAVTGGVINTLTDNSTTFIYVDYNSGTPNIQTTLDPITDIDGRTNTPIWIVTRKGNKVHEQNLCSYTSDFAYLSSQNSFYVKGYEHIQSGSVLTGIGTANLHITAGQFNLINKPQVHGAFDTSVSDTFIAIYKDGIGGWTETAPQTAINLTQFDDSSGTLATLSNNNKYAVHWVFVILNSPSELMVMYGRDEYDDLAQAQNSKLPADLPPELTTYSSGQLVGKIIIKKNIAVFEDIQNPFETTLVSSTASSHNHLGGLNTGDYQHLTASQYASLKTNDTPFTLLSSDTVLNLTTHKYIKVDTSGGDVTLTLPLSANGLYSYDIWKITNDLNKVIIVVSGSDTIIGDTSFEWNSAQYEHYEVMPDGGVLWLVK